MKFSFLLFTGRGKIVVSVGKANEWNLETISPDFSLGPVTASPPGGTCVATRLRCRRRGAVGVSGGRVNPLSDVGAERDRPTSEPPPPPSFDMCPAVGCDSYFFRWLCLCVRRFLDAVMAGVTSVHVTSVGLRQSTGWLCLYKTTDKMIGLISGGRRGNLNKISAL